MNLNMICVLKKIASVCFKREKKFECLAKQVIFKLRKNSIVEI